MEVQDYKCEKCGLEIVIAKEHEHELAKAECQDCKTMTMRPVT